MGEADQDTGWRAAPHGLRDAVLGEVHARPFHPLQAPLRILHVALQTGPQEGDAAAAAIAAFCRSKGCDDPPVGARHVRADLGALALRFERHSEFVTLALEAPAGPEPFGPLPPPLAEARAALDLPGRLLVSVDVCLASDPQGAFSAELTRWFEPASLAASLVTGGSAVAATDYRAREDGAVRILVADRGLSPQGAGALCQRLIEIETYRCFALLGLAEAQRLSAPLARIEDGLSRVARAMVEAEGLEDNRLLLDELARYAAALEADVAVSSFRFGATRAYDEIVAQRLEAIGETRFGVWPTCASFLARRFSPAMRTAFTMAARQTALAERLARAANLLRTRVDVEIERQNRDQLDSMNSRARMQLRLQQTVEGLSVAAVSYYVVGLVGYVLKGLKEGGFSTLDPGLATALAVPLALAIVAFMVRRIRKAHSDEPH